MPLTDSTVYFVPTKKMETVGSFSMSGRNSGPLGYGSKRFLGMELAPFMPLLGNIASL